MVTQATTSFLEAIGSDKTLANELRRRMAELDDSQIDEVAGEADIFGDLMGGIGGLPASLKKEFWPF